VDDRSAGVDGVPLSAGAFSGTIARGSEVDRPLRGTVATGLSLSFSFPNSLRT
jgi:hypothetical protein